MNKRIQELTGKALDKAVPYTWHNLDHIEVEKVMKEFAELIVRECSAYVEGTGNWLVAMEMKQHFGVE